jgi:iron(III) transport system permease protein
MSAPAEAPLSRGVPRLRGALRRLRPRHLLFAICLVVVGYIVIGPLFFLGVGSLSSELSNGRIGDLTFDNYINAYTDSRVVELIVNSLVFSLGSSLTALVIGTGLAWITERTDTPLRSAFLAFSLIPLIMPGVLFAIGWILLIGPRAGILSGWWQDLTGLGMPLDIFSLPGMIVVAGIHWAPLAFLIMAAALRSQDPSLEEAALMCGGSRWSATRRVVLPLTVPALLSLLLLLILRGLETFEVPGLIGLPAGVEVFSSRIYLAVSQLPADYGVGGAYAVMLLAITAIGVTIYSRLTRDSSRYATVTGKGYRPSVAKLGKWRILTTAILIGYFLFVVILPALAIVWNSFMPFTTQPSLESAKLWTMKNYETALSAEQTGRSVLNSIFLSGSSATVIVLFGAVLAWLTVRSRIRGAVLLDHLTGTALVFPGVVVGIALIWVYLTLPVAIYGTIWILFIAYITRYLPFGLRFASGSMMQMHIELEEASLTSGATALKTFRRVTLPLIWPGLAAGWLYIVVVSMSELSSAVFLWSPPNWVLAVVMFDYWSNGDSGPVYALGSMLIGALVLLTVVYERVNKKVGVVM